VGAAATAATAATAPLSLQDAARRAELVAALEAHGFNGIAAARTLGMPKSSFYAAIKKLGIKTR
jgi:transcriptional regulator of acetoin/glycerol metabolism